MTQTIPDNKKSLIVDLYRNKKYSIKEISDYLKVSVDATTFFFRKQNIQRRTQKEAQYEKFLKKTPSFKKNILKNADLKTLSIIGIMLYWAEGFKGNDSSTYQAVDFTNSDPNMIKIFLKFLRSTYSLNESKLRILLYCYSDQNVTDLVRFWSKTTLIPQSQFSKPYVKSNFNKDGNKMKHGMVHVRYSDKKLLLDIKSMIEFYVKKYAPVG
ncbi:MAG: hypothetical protein EXS47_01120 [Candidatus Zambryskibacteria bacterium]|nr:hypothetical protein [Candidatus Zambryskibacteria bacterium]